MEREWKNWLSVAVGGLLCLCCLVGFGKADPATPGADQNSQGEDPSPEQRDSDDADSDDADADADDADSDDADAEDFDESDGDDAADRDDEPKAEDEPTDEEKAKAAEEAARQQKQQAQMQMKQRRVFFGRKMFAPRAVQAGAMVGQPGASEDEEKVLVQADRQTMQLLSKGKKLLEEQRYAEGVRFLGKILEKSEDNFFQPDENQPIFRSLKVEAQRLIGEMPAEGRETYELQYGAQARQALEKAVEAGDLTLLADVARMFFHTQAGYEATYLLGVSLLDRSQPLAAALCFNRLHESATGGSKYEPQLSLALAACWARAGLAANAAATLLELKERTPDATFMIGGKRHKLFANPPAGSSEADRAQVALAWLTSGTGPLGADQAIANAEQWAMFRGSAQRNAMSVGSSPLLNLRWAVPTLIDHDLRSKTEEMEVTHHEQQEAALPGMHPLAVNGYVFLRSVASLVAVDFRTGKRVWTGPVDESVSQLLDMIGSGSMADPQLADWLALRIWQDATYGAMSSDGRCVFCVEDLGVNLGDYGQQQTVVLANGKRLMPPSGARPFNRLAAYEIATEGKLKWDLGSQPGDAELPLAGAFFLGPPLPLAERLYVLAELKGEIRLLALDSQTGHLEWSQQLAVLERTIMEDPLRRRAGVSPSYSDGVLVCPTSAGAVVAVDLITRSLLWGYQYPQQAVDANVAQMRVWQFRMGGTQASEPPNFDRWTDATVTVADGRVVLTPPESNQLHCLDLLSGNLLWQKPRDGGLYVGCVHDGKVLVVAQNDVRAYRLENGESAWPEATQGLQSGITPSGRGFFNGERYFVPLSSAEVASIDMQTGQVVARARSRSGSVPGNLICYQGAVISQGVSQLECYYQLEDLRQQVVASLNKNPDDPVALARNAELLLDEGQFGEAAASLRRSLAVAPSARTRALLVDALLEGLRRDFKARRDQIPEIESLIEQPAQQEAYARLLANGLEEAGEYWPAFGAYLKAAGNGKSFEQLERVESALAVRHDRWIQAHLAHLYQLASAEDQERMSAALQERLTVALADPTTERLERFLDYFGDNPLAESARPTLAARLIENGRLLEAQGVLRRLERSSKPELVREAVARQGIMLRDLDEHPEEAAAYYARLAGEWKDQVCLDGRTGQQLVDELDEESPLRKEISRTDPWPVGKVEVEDEGGPQRGIFNNFPLEVRGPRDPISSRWTVTLDQQQIALVARDTLGQERLRVGLRDANQMNFFGFNPYLSHVRYSGHLMVVTMGNEILALSSLGNSEDAEPSILWRQELADAASFVNGGIQQRVVNIIGGLPRFVATDNAGRPLGNLGPVNSEYICFQKMRNLQVVHPVSGTTLWQRNDQAPGSDLFGDEELLFVAAPNGTEAIVLRALDGQELGRRGLAPAEQRLALMGRNVASWRNANGKTELAMRDIWAEKDLWSHTFEADARPWLIGEEAVGVLDRSGHFTLVSLVDGSIEVDAMVEAEPNLSEMYVLRAPTQDFLVTNRPYQVQPGKGVQPVPGGYGSPLVNGMVHAFARHTGEKVTAATWSTRVEGHGMVLAQPTDLPVLTFATNFFEQIQQGGGQTSHAVLMCLDKRTGRVVYEDRINSPINYAEANGDPEECTVTIESTMKSVTLKFTNEPLPAEAGDAAQPGVDDQSSDGSAGGALVGQAILRGFARWAGGVDDADVDPADEEVGEPAAALDGPTVEEGATEEEPKPDDTSEAGASEDPFAPTSDDEEP